jgi:hypothetical protein
LDISWKALNTVGQVKIRVAAGNNFKEGNPDNYEMLAEVPIGSEHVLVSVKTKPSTIYKVYIEGPDNGIGRWFVVAK